MDDNNRDIPVDYKTDNYALSGKIMLISISIMFTVVFFLFCVHLYARWSLTRAHRLQYNLHRRNRRSHLIFTSDLPSHTTSVLTCGLDASVLKSLPTFVYNTSTYAEVLECAVCLSEFEENEKGLLLPKCKHSFHIDCINMWFQSHSTCPLCRTPVTPEVPDPNTETQVEIVVDSHELEPGTSSEPALKKFLSRERRASSCSSVTEMDRHKEEEEQAEVQTQRGENDSHVSLWV